MSLDVFLQIDSWIALVTLSAMEIVLGIDNIVFISILTGKLPPQQQPMARRIGLSLAMLMRIGLLLAISWVMQLTTPLFEVFQHSVSGRDLILGLGGLFLIGKATVEIYDNMELHASAEDKASKGASTLVGIVAQVTVLDIVFSLDSVITAVGMADDLLIMILAIVLAIGVMMFFAGSIGDFINRHPSMKILALSFLILIGVMLAAEALGQHVNKGYIYFAMSFALAVELVNMRVRRARRPATGR
jgi:predicted tellurium resistance membrane protein TerC